MTQAEKNRGNLPLLTFNFSYVLLEKFKVARDKKNAQKEMQIECMSPEDVLAELKNKALPVFGTN